jgi:hypothetical protein
MIAYQPGDIVTTLSRFHPCGRVVQANDTHCHVIFSGETYRIPADDLVVISIRNNPNLRLVTEKIDAAVEQRHLSSAVRHGLVALTWEGTIVARALADYIGKLPQPVVTEAIATIAAAGVPLPQAVERVLNLSFQFLVATD